MLLGELTDVTITSAPQFRVTARNVVLESRAMDSGVRVRLYVTHPALMYYFIRFGDVGSRHHLTGALNVSAFTFDDATRAFASIRLSVNGVRPLPNVDEDGNVIPTLATRLRVKDFPREQQFHKMKYIVYKYVWENINNGDVVLGGRGLNVETFALQVSDMYEDLVEKQLVSSDLSPVSVMEQISRPQASASGRPVPRVMRTTYAYNEHVRKTDWEHRDLQYSRLANDDYALGSSLFEIPLSPVVSPSPSPSVSSRARSSVLLDEENDEE